MKRAPRVPTSFVPTLILALVGLARAAAAESGPATGDALPPDWPPWDPAPACAPAEISPQSQLCAAGGEACALVDDVRVRCHGADLAFGAFRGGGHVLFSHPVRSRPRRLATVTTSGAAFSGPLPWDGEAGAVYPDPNGEPHLFLYGLRPAGGVAYAFPGADGTWIREDVVSGWPAVAMGVAFDATGRVHAVIGHPVERGPAEIATRSADGRWTSTRLAPETQGWPALVSAGDAVFGASFRADAQARGLLLEVFEGGERVGALPAGPRDEAGYPPVVRLGVLPGVEPPGAGLVALFSQRGQLSLSLPLRGGKGAHRVAALFAPGSSTCRVPERGPCPDGAPPCAEVYAGVVPYATALVADRAGDLWAAWIESRDTRTFALHTQRFNPMPVGPHPPPADTATCTASVVERVVEHTLVLAAVQPGRVDERLRVSVGPATLLGLHREADDLVLGLAEGSGAFRSITVRVDRLKLQHR